MPTYVLFQAHPPTADPMSVQAVLHAATDPTTAINDMVENNEIFIAQGTIHVVPIADASMFSINVTAAITTSSAPVDPFP